MVYSVFEFRKKQEQTESDMSVSLFFVVLPHRSRSSSSPNHLYEQQQGLWW